MQTAEAVAGTIPAAMIRPDYRGRDARRSILLALRQREREGLRTTLADLSEKLRRPLASIHWHVKAMRKAELLTTTRGPVGGITLTDAGRMAADTLPAED